MLAYDRADPVDGEGARVAVEALLVEDDAAGALVLRARTWIASHLREARIASCAGALRISTRSLQRALANADHTFRGMVAAERVSAAQARLRDGDAKSDAIARDVGCSSASQLGVLMRHAGLPSPSKVRRDG